MLEVALVPTIAKACENRPFYHGMVRASASRISRSLCAVEQLSFAYEQNGLLAEAEAAALRGIEIEPKDAWAHHGLAHALWGQRRFREGLDWCAAAVPARHRPHTDACPG
jgi:hypothetical protein